VDISAACPHAPKSISAAMSMANDLIVFLTVMVSFFEAIRAIFVSGDQFHAGTTYFHNKFVCIVCQRVKTGINADNPLYAQACTEEDLIHTI
jgi:hypothetical protein